MINSNAILEINKKNLIYNYKYLSHLANKSICAATIKANAYGLGDKEILKLLLKEGCTNFFLATTEEALNIRKINKNIRLFILNGLENNRLNLFVENNLIPILNSKEEIEEILRNKYYLKKSFKFGIHIETGLNRLGIQLKDINTEIFKISQIEIVISHLASSDELRNKYNKYQNKNFIKGCSYFHKIKYKSLCSSSGIFNNKNLHYDMVRPGISLYGCVDDIKLLKKFKIKPVITLKGKILQIKEINSNEFVGYNQTYKTKKKIKVAIIGMGYADGIPRKLSNNGKLYYKNQSFNIIGRISMDSITVDITKSNKKIVLGKYMEIINNNIVTEKMAIKCNTISNEILTSISKRVKRVYK